MPKINTAFMQHKTRFPGAPAAKKYQPLPTKPHSLLVQLWAAILVVILVFTERPTAGAKIERLD